MNRDNLQLAIAKGLFFLISLIVLMLMISLFFIVIKNPTQVVHFNNFVPHPQIHFNLSNILEIGLSLVVISQITRVFLIAVYFFSKREIWLFFCALIILGILLDSHASVGWHLVK